MVESNANAWPKKTARFNSKKRFFTIALAIFTIWVIAAASGATASTGVNVAEGKTATQSSTYSPSCDTIADKAVDGNADGTFFNCSVSSTTEEAQAWWQVDLGDLYFIDTVDIWNRTDCCGERLSDFDLLVSEDGSTWIEHYFADTAGTPTSFAINLVARYVKVQLRGTNFLSLAEVQVWSDGVVATPSSPGCTPQPPGLVSWWTAGGNAEDWIGDNDGALIGDTAYVSGKHGKAFDFDGSGDRVSVPADASIAMRNDFTAMAWFKVDSLSPDNHSKIFTKRPGTYGPFEINIWKDNGTIYAYPQGSVTGSSWDLGIPSRPTIQLGTWYHAAIVVDDLNLLSYYIDGEPAGTKQLSDQLMEHSGADFIIGDLYDGAHPLNGQVDETMIFGRALSADEIARIYDAKDMYGVCTAPNNAPVAGTAGHATNEDADLEVAAPGLLDNVTDEDPNPLTVAKASDPSHGTVTVNDKPEAAVDTYSTNEDAPLSVAAPGVLDNDTDTENDSLTAVKVTDPSNGTLALNADGSFTYTPDDDYNGPDSFTYKANDGALDSNVVTVNLTVDPLNDAPEATADSYATDYWTPLTVDAPGVLDNDTDAEEDTLTAVKVADPANGELELDADGSFTYTPDLGFAGDDTFTYKANDGGLDSNVVAVDIAVRPPVGDASLLGYWKLDDGSGTTALDSSVHLNHGTLSGGAAFDTDAAPIENFANPGAVSVSGATSSKVSIVNNDINQLTNDFTVMAWIKPESLSGIQRVVSTARTNSWNNGWGFGLNVSWLYFSTYGVENFLTPTSTGMHSGEWHHIKLKSLRCVESFPKKCTAACVPESFDKVFPTDGATDQPTSPTLTWEDSDRAAEYHYCYDTTDDDSCSPWYIWRNGTTRTLTGLEPHTTYYWHIRAKNSGGYTYSNDARTAYGSFTTGDGDSFAGVKSPDEPEDKIAEVDDTPAFYDFQLDGEGYIVIVRNDGLRAGFDPDTGEFVAEIPGAEQIPNIYGDGRNVPNIVRVPHEAGAIYTIAIADRPNAYGNQSSTADLIISGGGYVTRLQGLKIDSPEDVLTSTGGNDVLEIVFDGEKFLVGFKASELDDDTPSMSMSVTQVGDFDYSFQVSGAQMSSGSTLTVGIDPETGRVTIENDDPGADT